jgi:hypothetical protein
MCMPAPHNTLDYAPRSSSRVVMPRAAVWLIALLVLAFPLLIAMSLGAEAYASMKYSGLNTGMTRAQIERRLWAFSKTPNPAAAPPGQTTVMYELLGQGTPTKIRITYDANGVAVALLPIFIVCG